jgi:hypothetical protein
MFDVPQAVWWRTGPTVVCTADAIGKCARIMLHIAFTAPAGSRLYVYGHSKNSTVAVTRTGRALCPRKNVGANSRSRFIVIRDDGTTVELSARPQCMWDIRGDNPTHVFVVRPASMGRDFRGMFLGQLCLTRGRDCVFVGSHDADTEAARQITGIVHSIVW